MRRDSWSSLGPWTAFHLVKDIVCEACLVGILLAGGVKNSEHPQVLAGRGCLSSFAGDVRRCLDSPGCLIRVTGSDWVHSCEASAVVTFSQTIAKHLGVGDMSKVVMVLNCCLATTVLEIGNFRVWANCFECGSKVSLRGEGPF